MTRFGSLVFFCLALAYLQHAVAIYILVGVEKKCFTVEAPRDTPMVFDYEVLDKGEVLFSLFYGKLPDKELEIENKQEIWTKKEGNLDYVADVDGFYCYCVQQSSPSHTPTRLAISLTYGFDDKYYDGLAKDRNFDSVNLHVHKLNDLLTMTLNEADFQKHKEVDYHKETEKMNNAALWWPVIQIGILVITGVYQVQHLKNFFKSNKLI